MLGYTVQLWYSHRKALEHYYDFILLLYLEGKSTLPALGSRQNLHTYIPDGDCDYLLFSLT